MAVGGFTNTDLCTVCGRPLYDHYTWECPDHRGVFTTALTLGCTGPSSPTRPRSSGLDRVRALRQVWAGDTDNSRLHFMRQLDDLLAEEE